MVLKCTLTILLSSTLLVATSSPYNRSLSPVVTPSLQVVAASSLSTSSFLVVVVTKVGGLWDINYLEGWAPESLSYRLSIWEEGMNRKLQVIGTGLMVGNEIQPQRCTGLELAGRRALTLGTTQHCLMITSLIFLSVTLFLNTWNHPNLTIFFERWWTTVLVEWPCFEARSLHSFSSASQLLPNFGWLEQFEFCEFTLILTATIIFSF
jgi:hypothetical protein